MFRLLIAAYAILTIAMVACIRIISKGNIKNRKNIVRLIAMGIFTALSYLVFILIPSGMPRLATFMNGLYCVGTDWLALALMVFVADYTRLHPPAKWPKNILIACAGIDSISLVANTFTNHSFSLSWAGYWRVLYTALHPVHLTFVYLLVAYSIVLLLSRLIVAPRIYKGKYGAIFFLLIMLVVLNLICITFEFKFDYSVLIYGFIAISICYFVLYASPRRLLESMHSTLVGDSVIGLFIYDDDKQCVGMNQAAKDMFAGEGDDLYSAAEQYLAKWEEEHQGNLKSVMGAERTIVKDGETVYLYVNYQQLLDNKGRILGSGFQFENRTEMVKRYHEENYRATHDPLTGLLTRDAFEAEAQKILAEVDVPYCMVCTNIKDFKLINELCGTEVGDAILLAQADIIRGKQYGKTVSTRVYADKFCTLMPRDRYNQQGFMECMASMIERVLTVPLKAHFYFGMYEITDVNEPIWTMCDKAMMAIDYISGSYGQSFSLYKEEMFQRVIKEKEIIGIFDKAIAEQEFQMFLQPQIANDGTVVGAEALARWIHPEKGMVSPADFIPVLEKAGLIHRLDLYMWDKAAQKLAEWKKEGRDNLSISVNISTKDFYLIDVYEAFRDIKEKYDFDVKNLKLEITESALMRDVGKVMRLMDDLHGLGYEIEIDDFGSGYSSLGMLKDIHADVLKIDMIFLRETVNVTRSTTILKNVISMSKELGMPVITEGVETKDQVDFLQSTGCDMYQGFYFAKPMTVDSFEDTYSTAVTQDQ